MQRDPALHITHSDLIKVLGILKVQEPYQLAMEIFRKSAKYAIRNRHIVTTDSKTRKRAEKAKATNDSTAVISPEKFNQLLVAQRHLAGHRHVTVIRRSDSAYLHLQEVAQLASDFVKAYGFTRVEEGCKIYIDLGLKYMKNQFGINRFKYYNERIKQYYESISLIDYDPDKQATEALYEVWKEAVTAYANIERSLTKPEDYVYMIYARMEADSVKASYEDWVIAQFEELAFLDSIPSLTQLFGDKAVDRYYNYIGKTNSRRVKQPLQVSDNDFWNNYAELIKNKTVEDE